MASLRWAQVREACGSCVAIGFVLGSLLLRWFGTLLGDFLHVITANSVLVAQSSVSCVMLCILGLTCAVCSRKHTV